MWGLPRLFSVLGSQFSGISYQSWIWPVTKFARSQFIARRLLLAADCSDGRLPETVLRNHHVVQSSAPLKV